MASRKTRVKGQMKKTILCDGNVRIYNDFITPSEAALLTKWFTEFNYNGLPKHNFRFWGQRLMNPVTTPAIPGFDSSFDEIKDLNTELLQRVTDVLNEEEPAEWSAQPFNYIKMWKDSNPMLAEGMYDPELEMFYHVDNQDHMAQPIFWGMVIYPNEGYTGGRIMYPQYDLKYQPKAGDMIMHEGYVRHGVEKVISGDRFCMASLAMKNNVWNPDPKPTPTNRPEEPWYYPIGYNGVRMPDDPIKGFVKIKRPDGSVSKFKGYPDPAAGDTSSTKVPGGTRLIK